MDQTKVNQYFGARKSSSAFQPSKRRKLNSVVDSESQNRATPINIKKKGSIRKNQIVRLAAVTTKTALAVTPSLPSECTEIDQNQTDESPRRKIAAKHDPSERIEEVLSPERKESKIRLKSDKIQVNATLNDMAKWTMLCGVKESRSKQQKNDTHTVAATNIEPISTKLETQNTSSSVRRNKLRNKYAHLLHKEPIGESVTLSSNALKSDDKQQTLPEREHHKGARDVADRAHNKYRNLAQQTLPSSFSLPDKYKKLMAMFTCVDSVLFLLNQRSEICTYAKLKKSVQSMCKREFTYSHLAAMKTVLPDGFLFRQEQNLHVNGSKTLAYQLTIEANYSNCTASKKSRLNSSILITRRLKFETYLLNVTKQHHQKFLDQLKLSIPDADIHRWHPKFDLDNVPDIIFATLPQAPIKRSFSTASQLLQKENCGLAKKVEEALQNVASKSTKADESQRDKINEDNIEDKTLKKNPAKIALKGVSLSLIERIREKENRNNEIAMTRDPKQLERLSRISRLPEMARVLKAYFTAEKKAAITLEDCVQKLSESYGTALLFADIEAHVRLLNELVPSWINIPTIRHTPYVKLSKNSDINNVVKTILNSKKIEEQK